MKTFVAVLVLVIAGTTAELTEEELQEEWEKFKVVYNRNYKDPSEEQFRREIYFGRLRDYDEHNTKFDKGLVDYRLGVNPYSDYTDEELKPFLLDSSDLTSAAEQTARMAKSGSGDAEQQWAQFKVDFNKQYKDPTEEAFRKGLFLDRLLKNEEHNSKFDQGAVTFKVGINQFSDQTPEELASMHGFRKPGTGFGK